MSLIAHKPSQQLVDLVQALGGKWHGPIAMCRCPAHADNDPSLSLRQGDRGILVNCFAGCTPEDVLRELARVRITQRGTPPETTIRAGAGNAARIWNEAVDVRNTLAQRYLARRHFTTIPPDVRYHPRCPHSAAAMPMVAGPSVTALKCWNMRWRCIWCGIPPRW